MEQLFHGVENRGERPLDLQLSQDKKKMRKIVEKKIAKKASWMLKPIDFDTLIQNLMIPWLDVPPPWNASEKSTFHGGGTPHDEQKMGQK